AFIFKRIFEEVPYAINPKNEIREGIENVIDLTKFSLFVQFVGTNIACVTICDVGGREELVSRSFKIWKLAECSEALKASVTNKCTASVNRVIWSPEGSYLALPIPRIYCNYIPVNGGDDLQNHLEIDTHVGNVSDLAFTRI
ncbi:unnamed protein product, partial [Prunus brigantina]